MLIAGPSFAQTAEEKAKVLYEEGVGAFQEQDYGTALQRFERAYMLDPSPVLLYNLARAHEEMGHAREAAEHFQMYLDRDPGASDRAEVEGRIHALRASEGGPGSYRPWAWGCLAGAVASTAAGVALGIAVGDAESEHADARTGAAKARTAEDAERYALWTNVSFAAAGVLAAAGLTLFVLEPGGPIRVQGTPAGASVTLSW